MLRVVVFFLCLLWPFSTEIIFVEPVSKDGRYAITQIDGDLKAIELKESAVTSEMERIRGLFKTSPLLQYVLDLRKKAQNIHKAVRGQFGTKDTPQTPLFVHFGSAFGDVGPAMASGIRFSLGSVHSESLLNLAPLSFAGGRLTIDDFINEKYFGPLIAHEIFHAVFADLYGSDFFGIKARVSSRGHDSEKLTDEYMATLEGMAEALEVHVYDRFPDEVSDTVISQNLSPASRMLMASFKKKRLIIAGGNKFVFQKDGKIKDGNLDSAQVQIQTEGVIASLFYRLLFKSGWKDGFEPVFQVMAKDRPDTFFDLVRQMALSFPEERGILRQFVESTYYTTLNPQAEGLYKAAYLETRGGKPSGPAEKLWKAFKEEMFAHLKEGKIALDQALFRPYIVVDEAFFKILDLNEAAHEEIEPFFIDMGYEPKEAESLTMKLLHLRSKGVSLKTGYEIDSLLGTKLQAMHEHYLKQHEANLAEKAKNMQEGIYQGFFKQDLYFQCSH